MVNPGSTEKEPALELGQTQQRVSDLCFYLYRRPLHPELFCIHKNQRVQRGRYQANIWIMGLTHAVTIQGSEGCMTELTCAESDLLPANGLASTFRFRGERDHNEVLTDGIRYMMSSQVERLSQNLFEVIHRDMIRQAESRGLIATFDEWATEDGLAPFTYIEHEAREQELHVYTYHAFPGELTILKTQSIFEVSPPRVVLPRRVRRRMR